MKKNILVYILIIAIIALISIFYGIRIGKNSVSTSNDVNELANNLIQNNIIDSVTEISANTVAKSNITNTKYDVSYSSETFSSYNEENEKVCISERNIPTVINNSNPDSAKVIESDLRAIMDDVWENQIKKTSEEVKIRLNGERVLGVKYFVNMEYQTNKIITFSIKLDGDFGGVTWDGYELYSYDAQTGELLTLNNIGNDTDNLKNLIVERTKNVTASKQIQIDDTGNVGVDMLLLEKMASHGSFGILGDGIHINYQKYEIAIGAAGVIEVVIEKDVANKYIYDKYLID